MKIKLRSFHISFSFYYICVRIKYNLLIISHTNIQFLHIALYVMIYNSFERPWIREKKIGKNPHHRLQLEGENEGV